MKTLENNSRLRWWNRLNNALAVDTNRITSRAWAWGKWGLYFATPEHRLWFDSRTGDAVHPNQYQSQVWNARRFERIVYVDGKRRGWTWSWRPEGKAWKNTVILGWKINGRFALTFRFWHTDAASAKGTYGPNYGQATGDDWGPA